MRRILVEKDPTYTEEKSIGPNFVGILVKRKRYVTENDPRHNGNLLIFYGANGEHETSKKVAVRFSLHQMGVLEGLAEGSMQSELSRRYGQRSTVSMFRTVSALRLKFGVETTDELVEKASRFGVVKKAPKQRPTFTPKQTEVLEHLSGSLNCALVARELGVSNGSVKHALIYIRKKLNARSNYEAVVKARANGIVSGEGPPVKLVDEQVLVLEMAAQGVLPNKIAKVLGLSTAVESRVEKRLATRLKITDRSEFRRAVLACGLLSRKFRDELVSQTRRERLKLEQY